MNSCILMARITRTPEIRYTQDNQRPLAQMLVEFDGIRPDDPPTSLKVVGWGKLADEIQQNYAEGDRVIIEGRLRMNTIERQEGFKEKRVELTASRVHKVSADPGYTPASTSSNVVDFDSYSDRSEPTDVETHDTPTPDPSMAAPVEEKNLDDIPF
jgi:single-strand DNA-binding protein